MQDRILVVDDDPDNRAMIGHFLTNWGYGVDYAGNGKLALEQVAAARPDLVLLDLEMPEMDGIETCERLKSDESTETIPVVIFTGLEQMPHRGNGVKESADDYIVKTAEPAELRTRIELVLERARKYGALAEEAPNGNGHQAAAPEPASAASTEADSPPPAGDAIALPPPSLMSESLKEVSFPEAMQLALAYREDGVVRLTQGERTGEVHVDDGKIVHAALGSTAGEEAFYAFSLWTEGEVELHPEARSGERTIQSPTRSLLVEASRRSDAWRRISSKVPSFDLVPRCVPLAGSASIRLTRSDWAILRRADGKRTIAEIVDEIDTDLFEAGRVVFSLVTIGILSLETSDDGALDGVPERGEATDEKEPFVLSTEEWNLLARIESGQSLNQLRRASLLQTDSFLEIVEKLERRGFLTLDD